MRHLYHSLKTWITSSKICVIIKLFCYKKWRGASNYIANRLLNEAFPEGYSIAHGTTSTSSEIGKLYEKLKNNQYSITLLLCFSPEENRIKAGNYRASSQAFIQSTYQDTIEKGKAFFERFTDYFQWADKIHLYWVSDFLKPAVNVAIYSKGLEPTILDSEGFKAAENLYESYRAQKISLPSFASLNILVPKTEKYIVALLAASQEEHIREAQQFQEIAENYILSSQSLAHITLAQFYGEKLDYQRLESFLDAQKNEKIIPRFTGISLQTDKNNEGVRWIEHSIARDKPLLDLQFKISSFLQNHGLKLLNDDGDLYRPHLTLARVRASDMRIDFSSFSNVSYFDLVIGKADEFGQFIQLLKKF